MNIREYSDDDIQHFLDGVYLGEFLETQGYDLVLVVRTLLEAGVIELPDWVDGASEDEG
jgi:hypothetical protein